VLIALQSLAVPKPIDFLTCRSALVTSEPVAAISASFHWDAIVPGQQTQLRWHPDGTVRLLHNRGGNYEWFHEVFQESDYISLMRTKLRVFALDARELAKQSQLEPKAELGQYGSFFPVVLDRLRDENPEAFEGLRNEFSRWLPEFDAILFETLEPGKRSIALRTRIGHHRIPATELSQGTLLALAILTLAYLPEPPPLVGFEEPDRGLHPRLLRDVRDALYRLAYPESFGETRAPVQVIATTHNPYFLDLFKDHPEEIVIAEKTDTEARFVRLVDLPNMEEILEGANLGEVWYSGILGGVPAHP
jgi:predicted ATPase